MQLQMLSEAESEEFWWMGNWCSVQNVVILTLVDAGDCVAHWARMRERSAWCAFQLSGAQRGRRTVHVGILALEGKCTALKS